MTLAEIYTNIISIVFGDPVASPPPTHEVARIQEDILNLHKSIQRDYNYWFNYVKTTLSLIDGTDSYILPDDYKSLILLDTYYNYDILGNTIFFSNGISEDEDIRFDYWKFTSTPTTWSDDYTDNVTVNLGWVIIFTAVANLFLKRAEYQAYQVYNIEAEKSKGLIQNEDYYRRQDCISVWS